MPAPETTLQRCDSKTQKVDQRALEERTCDTIRLTQIEEGTTGGQASLAFRSVVGDRSSDLKRRIAEKGV